MMDLEELKNRLAGCKNMKIDPMYMDVNQLEELINRLQAAEKDNQDLRMQAIIDFGQYQTAHDELKALREQKPEIMEILSIDSLEAGCYYWCKSKAFGTWSIQQCLESMHSNGDSSLLVIGNGVWACEGNEQCFDKWEIYGPVSSEPVAQSRDSAEPAMNEKIKEALLQAVMVVAYRAGDINTEDGSYATTDTDSIIRLESALCEALGTKYDDIDLEEALALLNKFPSNANNHIADAGKMVEAKQSEPAYKDSDGYVIGENYEYGLWSRRNIEAFIADGNSVEAKQAVPGSDI